jgi:hypothetical protein
VSSELLILPRNRRILTSFSVEYLIMRGRIEQKGEDELLKEPRLMAVRNPATHPV